MVENGEWAFSVAREGYPNGAGVAYLTYAVITVVVALIIIVLPIKFSYGKSTSANLSTAIADEIFKRFSFRFFALNSVSLLVMLFGFGAINVWTGAVSKGEFRVGLGKFGAVAYLLMKFILPGLLAHSVLLYSESTKSSALRFRLLGNMSLVFLFGSTWGFKSTSMFMLLPALLLVYWNIRPATLFRLAVFSILSIVLFTYIFDSHKDTADVFGFLLTRVTVIQGDISWYVWDLYKKGEVFPGFSRTLLAGVGDNTLSVFGVIKEDQYNWMLYHYDWMLNYVAGYPLESSANGGNVTGTPFSEGLIAGGMTGVLTLAAIAGLIIGAFFRLLRHSLRHHKNVLGAVGSCYFCFVVFPWLNGGAVASLYHVANLFGLAITFFFILLLRENVFNTNEKNRVIVAS